MISDTVRFWSYLLVLIPSFLCSLFVLYHLLFDRALRNALNNHVIIILVFICLIAEVTFYPWMLYFYQNKDVWERSLMFCVIWGFLDWTIYVIHTMLFAWATIERHILIFHEGWLSTKKRRFFIHYLPLILLPLYLFIFYIVMYFFPNCENRLRPSIVLCIFPCLYDIYIISMWDFVVDQLLPILTIIVFSSGLFVRVLRQRVRMRRTIHWRKHRKMTIQLLSISFFYLIILLPYAVVYIVVLCGLTSLLISDFRTYTAFLSYFIILLFPFVCALSLPELQTKMKNIFQLRRQTSRGVSFWSPSQEPGTLNPLRVPFPRTPIGFRVPQHPQPSEDFVPKNPELP
jgi:hypothetical protein